MHCATKLFAPFLLILLAACGTSSLTDPTGLKIELDGDFVIEKWADIQPPYTAMMSVTTKSGNPYAESLTTPICLVGFQPFPENAGKSQQAINAEIIKPEWVAMIEQTMTPQFNFEAEPLPFELAGAKGYQFVTSIKGGVNVAKARVIFSALETPKGRTIINCGGDAVTLKKAMPVYDAIRAGVTPPA